MTRTEIEGNADIFTRESVKSDETSEHFRCRTGVTEAISSGRVEVLKVCSDCKKSFTLKHFHKKSEGRWEKRCIDCHNEWRRSRYQKKPRPKHEPKVDVEYTHQHLDESNEGFQLLLDMVCDDVLKGLL